MTFLAICLVCFPAEAKKKKILPSEQAVFHNNQGISFLSRGDLDKAVFEFQTATELAPQYAEPVSNLGVICKIRGEYDKSLSYFNKAAKIDKHYAAPWSHIAAVYLATGKPREALKAAKKAVKIDPLLADAHYNLGIAYWDLK
ncbi:MAG: tetratricopeptide repeat protein, partial [bacterium]|nr:tetratricopeptide repeat protein [bacterium]